MVRSDSDVNSAGWSLLCCEGDCLQISLNHSPPLPGPVSTFLVSDDVPGPNYWSPQITQWSGSRLSPTHGVFINQLPANSPLIGH